MKSGKLLKKVILFILFTTKAFSQAGIIDSTFGINGVVSTPLSTSLLATCRNVLALPNGQYIATGFTQSGVYTYYTAVRYNNNGSIDNAFGTNGISQTTIGTSTSCYSYCSALQSDGKIVLGGDYYDGTGYQFGVTRLLSNGQLDTLFGTGGSTSISAGNVPPSNYGGSIAIQSTGKIIISGTAISTNTDFCMARLKSDGSIDNTFGTNGVVITPIGSLTDNCYSMAIQSDDKIVLAGDISIGTTYVFACARYDMNGNLDNTFGTNGIGIYPMGTTDDDYGYGIVIQPDKKIVFGGTGYYNSQYNFVVLRVDSNGVLDSGFGANGFAINSIVSGSGDSGRSLALQSDGKIVVAGRSYLIGSCFAIIRFDSSGIIDTTFGINGASYIAVANAQHYVYGLALDPDNKLIVCGNARTAPDNFYLLRYESGLSTGIEEFSSNNNSLLIYPNPTTGKFTISNTTNENIESLRIFDAMGTLVFSNISKFEITKEMEISLSKGLYFIESSCSTSIRRSTAIVQ